MTLYSVYYILQNYIAHARVLFCEIKEFDCQDKYFDLIFELISLMMN